MIEIFDETESKLDGKLIKDVFTAVAKEYNLPDNAYVELTVADGETIREVNKEYRDVDSVTDVLSFPNLQVRLPFNAEDYPDDVDMATGELLLGEIMLCYDRAVEQSREYGHSVERECAYLVLHGLLHLLGYDHMTDGEKTEMRAAEEKILTGMGITRD